MTFDNLINLLVLLGGGVVFALRIEYRMSRLEIIVDSIKEEIGGRRKRGNNHV